MGLTKDESSLLTVIKGIHSVDAFLFREVPLDWKGTPQMAVTH